MLQDLRFSFRLIAKDPWFSAAAIAALALGIGINAIGFTIVNAAFLRGLPVPDASRLYTVEWQFRRGHVGLSFVELQEWRAARAFESLAAFRNGGINLSDSRALPDQARGTWITANAFRTLGDRPVLGRDFTPADERPGADPVAIIGFTLWKIRYASSQDVLGLPIRINGKPATIVGVMPAGSKFPNNTDVWVPLVPEQADAARDAHTLHGFGRLRRDSSIEEATTELTGITNQLIAAYPASYKDITGPSIETFTERYVGGAARRVFLVMMGAVSFVLLIACANVANLLLSRSANRAREVAVRIAMGATRWRIVRQLLLESVVLGAIGGAIGLPLATVAARVLDAAIQDPDKPYWIVFSVDYTVSLYVAAVCVLTAVLFGLAPALHVSSTNINGVLKEGGRGATAGVRTRWMTAGMVVMELALTIMLLAGAGLMIRSFLKLYSLDVGFSTDHLLTMRLRLPATQYPDAEARRAFYDRVEPRLAAIAGVESVAMADTVPPFGNARRTFEIEGRPPVPDGVDTNASTVTVGPRFFDVVGVDLQRGRPFDARDGRPGAEHVIINAAAAARYFQGQDPIGQRIRFRDGRPGAAAPIWQTIIGVSPTIRHAERASGEPNPVVYVPFAQNPPAGTALLIRSRLPPPSVMEAIRRAVSAVDPDQPVFTIQTLDDLIAEERWPFRVFGGLFALFAGVALLLSSVGLYAVTAYSVTQRTQEIGVRMALGAERGQVAWLILKRGLAQLAIGLGVGLGAALAVSRVLRSVVQVPPTDPVTFATITLLLTGVSVAACLIPARRATRIDPLVALRAD